MLQPHKVAAYGNFFILTSVLTFRHASYPEPQSKCAFGSPGFDQSESKTFVGDPDKNFNISYGDGEFLTGVVGFDAVTVGDMTVTNQEIGLVNEAAWDGDGVNTVNLTHWIE